MPRRYKPVDECRPAIQRYVKKLESASDEQDPELRNPGSADRYKQDVRWYDEWLDDVTDSDEGMFKDVEIDSVTDVTSAIAEELGMTLSEEFNGTTGRYRWDRIFALHDWLSRREGVDNPLEEWNDDKDEEFGLTKTTEQSRRLGDDEHYATTEEDIRVMEENVHRYEHRDRLIIRLLWQTGLRRGEASKLLVEDIPHDAREIIVRKEVAKNDEKRVVAYQPSLDGLLAEWLDYGRREEMAAGRDHDRLLVGEKGAPLSGDRINTIVIDAANRAGINKKIYADANAPEDEDGNTEPNRWKITAHNVRHGFGSHMVNNTDAGLWEVSNLMGHSSIQITEEIYVEDDPRAGIEHGHKYGPE